MALIKSLLFTILVPGTVVVYVPYRILLAEPAGSRLHLGAIRYLGMAFMIVGALIYLWCVWHFAITGRGTPAPIDPPKELVVKGLYQRVRNPMYLGVASILGGEGVFFESRFLFVYLALVVVAVVFFVLLYEEPVLRAKFGPAYEEYRRSVPRFFPRLRRPSGKGGG